MKSTNTCLERRRDGGWGWVVVASGLLSQILLGGICLSSGLFYVIFRDAFGSSPVETSWLCALPITLWFYSSPLGSVLTNKFGFRVSAFIGGVLSATGLGLGFFAPNIGLLFFSHGLLTGIGFGINYTAGMTAVNVYFDKYKTAATGLCSIGHNAGLVIYSYFTVFLEQRYGWRGSMLIHGAIVLNMCVFALLLEPLPKSKTTSHKLTIEAEEGKKASGTDKVNKRKFISISVFKNSAFVCFCLSNIMVNTGQGIYILHLPSYSKDIGFTGNDIGTVLAFYGITNIIGKVVYISLGQHPRIDITALYTTSLTATGVCIGLTPLFTTRAGLLTLASLVGFFYCVTGALLGAVIFRIVGFDRFADGVGISMPFKATGNLIGGPLAGFLYVQTGDYGASFFLGGACLIVGSVLMIPPIIKHRRDEKSMTSEKNNTIQEHEVEPLTLNVEDSLKNVVE